jgi:hypothetical protein
MTSQTRCSRCGSERIIRGVALRDSFGDAGILSKQSGVSVQGEPDAWVFKDSASGKLTLDICGDCGRAEFQVSDFRELYEKYQKSRNG